MFLYLLCATQTIPRIFKISLEIIFIKWLFHWGKGSINLLTQPLQKFPLGTTSRKLKHEYEIIESAPFLDYQYMLALFLNDSTAYTTLYISEKENAKIFKNYINEKFPSTD